ncbi:MAG: ABC-type sugar transport system, periplasmic component [Verrucomicrobia bacterium]|nr:ABC-type sugar transport system, periplasmic component [Verrucomicrobiota bacterium]
MKFKHLGYALLGAGYVAAAVFAWNHSRGPAGRDRVTVRLCHWQLEGTVREGLLAVARRYEQLHPEVKVEILVVPETIYRQWMRTQLVGGTAPDLIEYTMYWGRIEELAPRYFAPVTREVAQPNPYNRGTPLAGVPWRDTFLDGMNGPDGYNTLMREYYAPTIAMFTLRLFYNRTLLREITGRDEPPATWREFLALRREVEAFARRNGRVLSTISNSADNSRWMALPVMEGMGSHFSPRIDHDHTLSLSYWELAHGLLRGEWSFRTPEIANGLAVFRELGLASQPGFVQVRRDVALLDFLRGHGLIVCAGSWDASSLKREAPFEVGAFRLPLPGAEDPEFAARTLGPLSDGSVQTGTAFYLNKASGHPEAAIDFLRFLTSVEGDQIFVNVSEWLPAIKGVRPTDFSRRFMPFYDGYYWSANSYFHGTGVEMNMFFLQEMHRLFGPNGSVAAFQDEMDRDLPAYSGRDLRAHLRDSRQAFIGDDVSTAARMESTGRTDRLPASPALLEARHYQTAREVAIAAGRPQPEPGVEAHP